MQMWLILIRGDQCSLHPIFFRIFAPRKELGEPDLMGHSWRIPQRFHRFPFGSADGQQNVAGPLLNGTRALESEGTGGGECCLDPVVPWVASGEFAPEPELIGFGIGHGELAILVEVPAKGPSPVDPSVHLIRGWITDHAERKIGEYRSKPSQEHDELSSKCKNYS